MALSPAGQAFLRAYQDQRGGQGGLLGSMGGQQAPPLSPAGQSFLQAYRGQQGARAPQRAAMPRPQAPSQGASPLGSLRQGVGLAGLGTGLLNQAMSKPGQPFLSPQVSGGLNLAGGGLGIAQALAGDAPTASRVVGGLQGANTALTGLSQMGAIPSSVGGFTGQAAPILGTLGAGVNIGNLIGSDYYSDTEKALKAASQAAQAALSYTPFAWAAPVVGMLESGIESMVSEPNIYARSRQQAGGDVQDVAPILLDQLLMAQNPGDLQRAFQAAQASSGKAGWDYNPETGASGVRAYEGDVSGLERQIASILGAKRAQFGGAQDPSLQNAITAAQGRRQASIQSALMSGFDPWYQEVYKEHPTYYPDKFSLAPRLGSRAGEILNVFDPGAFNPAAFQAAYQPEVARRQALPPSLPAYSFYTDFSAPGG